VGQATPRPGDGAVASLPSVSAGEWATAPGRWVQDKEFGLQFRAEMLTSTAPTTKEGSEKYLGSGVVTPPPERWRGPLLGRGCEGVDAAQGSR